MIYGDRLRLRHVEREDLPRFVAWLNDPEVRQGLSGYLPLSMAEEEQWFEGMLKRPPDEQPFVIEARKDAGWVPLGNCSVFAISWRHRSAELGIFLGEKSLWNQGYGTEAMGLLLRHGFHTLNLHRLYLRVHANNPRAIRAYEKAGFVLEGREREAVFQDGKYQDGLRMAVLRHEWEKTLPPLST